MAIRKEQWEKRHKLSKTDEIESGSVKTRDMDGSVITKTLTPTMIDSLEEQATTRTRKKWLENQPKNERTIVQCGECQNKLRQLSWLSGNAHGFGYFEPEYNQCSKHPELFKQWVSDLTHAMNFLHQRR